MKNSALIAIALTLALPLASRPQMQPTETVGSYKSPEHKAMDALSRGLRYKKKADDEQDPAKKAKLYAKAKEALGDSLGHQNNFNAFLALGQVHLALGENDKALSACAKARGLKPGDTGAQTCIEQAQGTAVAETEGEGR